MIRFALFYFFVIHYRVAVMLGRILYNRSFDYTIDGDQNALSSPIKTMDSLLRHPAVKAAKTVVDVGCGEGLVAMWMALVRGKWVLAIDHQRHYTRMIQVMAWLLGAWRLNTTTKMTDYLDADTVVVCVWTSWSRANRQRVLHDWGVYLPTGAHVVTVSHGMSHPAFDAVAVTRARFAWGDATVYYYRHA